MSKGRLISALAVVVLSVGFAHAAEAVRFADGRYLEIDYHRVDGEWIELQMPGMVLYVEAGRIDRIERSGRVLYARPGLLEAERLHREKMVLERWGRPRPVLTSSVVAKPLSGV